MKAFYLLNFCLLIFLNTPHAQQGLRVVNNQSFKRGEKLTYKVHYGFIDAVEATIEITEENKSFKNRNTLHVVGIGKSKGTFDYFFKVRDRYESYIDEQYLVPWYFGRRVDEGGFKIAQDYYFDHYNNKVEIKKSSFLDIVNNTQDMISGFYLARTFDLSNAKMNQTFKVPTVVDGEMYDLQIKFKGKEKVKTKWGYINCLKFVPVLQKGRIFKHEEDLIVWISDDKNHVPIKAKADILFGSIKLDLIDFKGLYNPMLIYKK
ncbi:MAG: DUF3108 domain-containing protein [Chitinophagaceae bacterium]